MKSFFFLVVLLVISFFLGHSAARWKFHGKMIVQNPFSLTTKQQPLHFNPAPYPSENHSFCIIITGRNNGANLEKTLESALDQKYDRFRVIYIDDGSHDGSFELAEQLIQNSQKTHHVQLIRHEQPLGEIAGLTSAVSDCLDEEIILILSGDDWLAHPWVLQLLNQYYADPDLWLTYGQSIGYPTFEKQWTEPDLTHSESIRPLPFAASPPHTFYATLFKRISLADLIPYGEPDFTSSHLAYMIPMLEMAKGHFQCLPDVLYIVNQEAPKDEPAEKSIALEKEIRSLPSYQPLADLLVKPVPLASEGIE